MRFLFQPAKSLKNLWSLVSEACQQFNKVQLYPYKILSVDTIKCTVILHCSGTQAVIKISFSEALADPAIVKGLSSVQACWLGYYYARFQKGDLLKRSKNGGVLGFAPSHKKSRFKIVSFDIKSAVLTYYDKRQSCIYKEQVTAVAQNRFVLNNIDSTQACFIGMQAGYEVIKHGSSVLNANPGTPLLKVVK